VQKNSQFVWLKRDSRGADHPPIARAIGWLLLLLIYGLSFADCCPQSDLRSLAFVWKAFQNFEQQDLGLIPEKWRRCLGIPVLLEKALFGI